MGKHKQNICEPKIYGWIFYKKCVIQDKKIFWNKWPNSLLTVNLILKTPTSIYKAFKNCCTVSDLSYFNIQGFKIPFIVLIWNILTETSDKGSFAWSHKFLCWICKNICGSTGPGGPDIKQHWTLVCFYLRYFCFRRARIWLLWRRTSYCWTNQRATPSLWTKQATRPGKTKTQEHCWSSIEPISQPSPVNN